MSHSFFEKELILLLKSNYPIIYINSCEEERLESYLRKLVHTNLNYSLYSWDFIQGYTGNPNDSGFAANNPLQALDLIENLVIDNSALILLKDFNLFLKDLAVQRKLRNIFQILNTQSQTLIITAVEVNIPLSLREIITVIDFPLPGENEIRKELNQFFSFTETKIDLFIFNRLISACQGLSIERIRRVISKIFVQYGEFSEKSLESILIEKKQIISQTQILEFYPNQETINDIGGLVNLKKWLNRRSGAFSDKAKRYGITTTKGLLLVGIQGTGKSLSA